MTDALMEHFKSCEFGKCAAGNRGVFRLMTLLANSAILESQGQKSQASSIKKFPQLENSRLDV